MSWRDDLTLSELDAIDRQQRRAEARQRQIEAEDRALREAMIDAGAMAVVRRVHAQESGDHCQWSADILEASGALDLAAAVQALLRRHDEEDPGEAFAPDAGCLECTAGQTPTKWQTGTCPHHRIVAILGRLRP